MWRWHFRNTACAQVLWVMSACTCLINGSLENVRLTTYDLHHHILELLSYQVSAL